MNDLITILYNSLSNDLSLILMTTPSGNKVLQKTHPNLINVLYRIDVKEVNANEMIDIISNLKENIQNEYSITIDDEFIQELIRLCDNYIHWEKFPGKAFKVLFNILNLKKSSSQKLTVEDVYNYFKDLTGLPREIISKNLKLSLNDIKNFFDKSIFGQDEAVNSIIHTILKFKTGLTNENKPISSFLFVGLSGIGKTEIAKTLAKYLFGSQDKLFIYPMAQYRDYDGFLKLFGTGENISETISGYGKLLNDVRTTPFSVILFDEIDQADRNVINALYQILDEGVNIENNGDVVSFKSTIIIMTTNLGMANFFSKNIGFNIELKEEVKLTEDVKNKIIEDLENYFGEPFLNRISKIVIFKPLTKDILNKIVIKNINNLNEHLPGLKNRNIKIEVSDDIIDLIIKYGYSEKYGARKVQKIIDEIIIEPLSEFLSQNPELKDAKINFYIDNEKINYSISSLL